MSLRKKISLSFSLMSRVARRLKLCFRDRNEYLVTAVCRGHGNYRPERGEGRGEALATEIDKFTDMIFGSQNDVSFFLGTDRFQGAIPKPVISASDAHNLNEADPTFEGLKQIIYEPKARVRIQAEDPSESETYAKVGKAQIQLPIDLKISDEY